MAKAKAGNRKEGRERKEETGPPVSADPAEVVRVRVRCGVCKGARVLVLYSKPMPEHGLRELTGRCQDCETLNRWVEREGKAEG